MKKLSLKNLKLEVNDILQREQLKTVFGGYVNDGDCRIFVRMVDSNGNETGQNYWTDKIYSVESAQEYYDGGSGDIWYGGTYGNYKVTGYCCQSC